MVTKILTRVSNTKWLCNTLGEDFEGCLL